MFQNNEMTPDKYKIKYLKYKEKYLKLKNSIKSTVQQKGGYIKNIST